MLDYINEDHITVRTDFGLDSVHEKVKMPVWFYSVVKDLCNYYGLSGNIDPTWVMKHDIELVEAYLKKIGLEFEKFKLDKLKTVGYTQWNTQITYIPEGYVFKSNPELTALILKYGTE